ncbi:hypothetical protein BS78_05G248500, partial [Paspalum vaginatum]
HGLAPDPSPPRPPPPPFPSILNDAVVDHRRIADYDHADGPLTHLHLYVHETYTGPNATAAAVLQSPLGATTSSFGSIGVVDDEIRSGPDRSSSALLGRYQGVFFGTSLELGKGYLSSITLVFTAVRRQHAVRGGTRAGVHGHHRARRRRRHQEVQARAGCMLFKMISKPTPETDVNEVHLFVLMSRHGKHD